MLTPLPLPLRPVLLLGLLCSCQVMADDDSRVQQRANAVVSLMTFTVVDRKSVV